MSADSTIYLASATARQWSRRQFLASSGAAGASLLASNLYAFTSPQTIHLPLDIVPTSLEIAPGHLIRTTAYYGSADDVIRLPENRSIDVEIKNQSQQMEYVHWHGFEVPVELDGTCEEGSIAVQPGQSIRYQLPSQRAGSYYVHSHSMTGHHMEGGMYGGQFRFVLVEPASNPGRYDREVILTTHEWEPYMLNERQEERRIEDTFHLRPDPEEAEELGEGGWDIRYRIASINGRALGHGESIRVKAGERVLFRILNASATENIQLALPGHTFQIIAMDASPVPVPSHTAVLALGVGERIDAIVEMNAPGIWILGSTDQETRTSGMGIVVEYANQTGDPIWTDPTITWDYTSFASQAVLETGELLSFELQRLPLAPDEREQWVMTGANGKPIPKAINLQRNQTYRIHLRNLTNEPHPMHLHRHSFELVRYSEKPTSGLLKDTIVVPPYDSVELAFTPAKTGLALFHCHNQMHMGSGLQTLFNVS